MPATRLQAAPVGNPLRSTHAPRVLQPRPAGAARRHFFQEGGVGRRPGVGAIRSPLFTVAATRPADGGPLQAHR